MDSVLLKTVKNRGIKNNFRVVDLEGNVTALLDPKFDIVVGTLVEYPLQPNPKGEG